MLPKVRSRAFVCYLSPMGIDNISLGISVNWWMPNVEIHLPFCFIRIGWQAIYLPSDKSFYKRVFGKVPYWWED